MKTRSSDRISLALAIKTIAREIQESMLGPSIWSQLNRRRSSDVTGSINRLRCRVPGPFPPVAGQGIGGAFLERQEPAGELLLHKAIPGRA
ncbi:hypothetical protein CHARACLAT_018455 [Characodon lateralis]|uniref:Uncharacterized protein n=1 Tax=Characodon lateralis TaxID=208331 RepID=A0ABU7F797_9TELE|nr:hypothetical protein [Characodon lateralis]